MASKRNAPAEGMRRCIGSSKFGIEAHEAPIEDSPVQPSQKDGLGRMCKTHWRQYTAALRKAAIARQPAPAFVAEVERAPEDKTAKTSRTKGKPAPKPEPIRTKATRKAKPADVPAEA
jgi:hypothetical protein